LLDLGGRDLGRSNDENIRGRLSKTRAQGIAHKFRLVEHFATRGPQTGETGFLELVGD
jgi:hypothetical protein